MLVFVVESTEPGTKRSELLQRCVINYQAASLPLRLFGRSRIPESQHGRGQKGPLWVTQSNPLPKQSHPEQAARDRVQPGTTESGI